MSVATPQATDAAVKMTSPARNTRLPPSRSASEPPVSRKTASVSAYASMTHCRPEKSACRVLRNSGSATFTTVRSRVSMNVPTVTIVRVHHRVGDGAAGTAAGSVAGADDPELTALFVEDIGPPWDQLMVG